MKVRLACRIDARSPKSAGAEHNNNVIFVKDLILHKEKLELNITIRLPSIPWDFHWYGDLEYPKQDTKCRHLSLVK